MKIFIVTFICLLTQLYSLSFSQIGAREAELIAGYTRHKANCKVKIQPAGGTSTTLYDRDFKPVTDPQAYLERTLDTVFFNAVWDRSATSTNGTVYYGKYQISFINKDPQTGEETHLPGSPVYIDFRDADYTNQYNFYLNQFDFFVYYDPTRVPLDSFPQGSGGVQSSGVYFLYGSVDTVARSIGIWELKGKPQNTSQFLNFQTKVTGLLPFFPVNITVGSTNYQVANNESVALATGFGTPQPVVVTAQNRKVILPVVYGYRNFSSWKDPSGNILKLFDTTYSTTMGGELASILTAHYKGTYQADTVTGPTSFNNKTYLTFTCNHTSVSGGTYAYDWWIKYDFNNTWQRLGGGLKTKSIMTTPDPAYSFYIKCYLKDYVDTVGVWSNDLRVEYYDFGDPVLAFKDPGDKTLNSQPAVDQESYDVISSETTGSWWPVNADALTAKQKIQILLPIKETVKELTHKFRWKETDPFEPFDNERFFDDLEKNTDNDHELDTKLTENLQENAQVTPIDQLSKTKSSELDKTASIPTDFTIHQNYPNPFNPSTTIRFELAKPVVVKLTIYNSLGQSVRNLYEGSKSAGRHDLFWDGKNDHGIQVPSGIYIYRLEAGEFTQSKKMTLVK